MVFWDVCWPHSDSEGCWDLGHVPVGSSPLDDTWRAVGVLQRPHGPECGWVRWGLFPCPGQAGREQDRTSWHRGSPGPFFFLPVSLSPPWVPCLFCQDGLSQDGLSQDGQTGGLAPGNQCPCPCGSLLPPLYKKKPRLFISAHPTPISLKINFSLLGWAWKTLGIVITSASGPGRVLLVHHLVSQLSVFMLSVPGPKLTGTRR